METAVKCHKDKIKSKYLEFFYFDNKYIFLFLIMTGLYPVSKDK